MYGPLCSRPIVSKALLLLTLFGPVVFSRRTLIVGAWRPAAVGVAPESLMEKAPTGGGRPPALISRGASGVVSPRCLFRGVVGSSAAATSTTLASAPASSGSTVVGSPPHCLESCNHRLPKVVIHGFLFDLCNRGSGCRSFRGPNRVGRWQWTRRYLRAVHSWRPLGLDLDSKFHWVQWIPSVVPEPFEQRSREASQEMEFQRVVEIFSRSSEADNLTHKLRRRDLANGRQALHDVHPRPERTQGVSLHCGLEGFVSVARGTNSIVFCLD